MFSIHATILGATSMSFAIHNDCTLVVTEFEPLLTLVIQTVAELEIENKKLRRCAKSL